MSQKPPAVFDWQGHRGCRGLMPENTIPAFLEALRYPVTTLELDLAVSKDGRLIISHEPWMSHHICNHPNGQPVATEQEAMSLRIMDMNYDEIKKFDCGSRGNERFPQQKKMPAHKPSLRDMVNAVKKYCRENNRPLPHFNMEIKSRPEGDNIFHPEPEKFAALVLNELDQLEIRQITCIQSFDVRPLQVLHKTAPDITLALLVENEDPFQTNLDRLGFRPDIYSCYYILLKKRHVKKLHKMGIKVIPWTVNTIKDMKKMKCIGVDGIITDFPNLGN